MDVFLSGAPWYKRWFWQIASRGLYPTIFATIGFAYIGIPSELQAQIRRVIPYAARKEMLHEASLNKWMLTFLVLTAFCAVWGALGNNATVYFTKEKYKKLLADYTGLKSDYDSKSIDCYKLFSDYLYGLCAKLKLGPNERISLYKLDLEKYSCIGRFSENGRYNGKPNRLYPLHQGCIAKAWEIGKVSDGSSPDPNTEWSKYVEYHVKTYGFSEQELTTLRMKSRSFHGIRLQNLQNQTIAVLMLESTESSGLSFGKINKVIDDREKRNLSALIESLESHMPSLERAASEGF